MEEVWKVIETKYTTKCSRCHRRIKKGKKVQWNPSAKSVRHFKCKKVSQGMNSLNAYRPPKGRARHFTF